MRDSAYLLDVLIDCCNDITGLETVKSCLIVPTATGVSSLRLACHVAAHAMLNRCMTLCCLSCTGMAHVLALSSIKASRPPQARYVLWSRIDQQTCFKAIYSAGTPLICASAACQCVVMQSHLVFWFLQSNRLHLT